MTTWPFAYFLVVNITIKTSGLVPTEPDTLYRSVGKAPEMCEWMAIESSGEWKKIYFAGRICWINNGLLVIAIPPKVKHRLTKIAMRSPGQQSPQQLAAPLMKNSKIK
jgi:hypothetical protein